MSTTRTVFVPIDKREPATVRAVILARSSDPSAKPEDMSSQVDGCVEFIGRMGWTLAFPAYAYCEAATGMRQVERPMLDEVLRLAVTGQVDVIVVREFERIARTKGRRATAIQTALDYGCEFRFANIAPDGRMPEDRDTQLIWMVKEWMAEGEVEKLDDRLNTPKRRRYEQGLPHGGRNGPLYGYAGGARRYTRTGKAMGLLSWVINEDTASIVRWLYQEADTRDPMSLTLRGLATELVKRGVLSPTGLPRWTVKQVSNILRNPKYCGPGQGIALRDGPYAGARPRDAEGT